MNRKIRMMLPLVLLVLCMLVAPLALSEAAAPGVVQIHQMASMGCTDSYLVTDGETVILVDCGLDTDTSYAHNGPLLEYLEASGIDHVDAHFITHYHNDHCYNLNLLNELYGTDTTIVYGPSDELPSRFQPLKNGHYEQLVDNQELNVGPFAIRCIGPAKPVNQGATNYDSLNFYLTYGKRIMLFTGDWVDWKLFDRHPESASQIDILSFPHHGLEPFCIQEYELHAMNPEYVLVPGKRAFQVRGFLKFSSANRAQVFDTADGNIVILTDGDSMALYTQVEPGRFSAFAQVTVEQP